MVSPFQIACQRLFLAAALLMSVISCERQGKGGGATISKAELKKVSEASANAKSMVKVLEAYFEGDGYAFSPIDCNRGISF